MIGILIFTLPFLVQSYEPLPDDFECDKGFWLDRSKESCIRNQCFCDNGDAVVGPDCPKHQAHACFECNDRFFLDDNDRCRAESTIAATASIAEAAKPVVCRNSNIRNANMTLVDWLNTDDFLQCTDLLLSVRIGNSGDHGAKAIAAALIRAGSKSKLQHLILTGGAIGDDGAEWLAAALGGPVPEYEEDDDHISVATSDVWIEDPATEMLLGPFDSDYEKGRVTELASTLRRTIGTVRLVSTTWEWWTGCHMRTGLHALKFLD